MWLLWNLRRLRSEHLDRREERLLSLSWVPVVASRGATWPRPLGWGERQPGDILPMPFSENKPGHSPKGFTDIFPPPTPTTVYNRWVDGYIEIAHYWALKSTQKGDNVSFFYTAVPTPCHNSACGLVLLPAITTITVALYWKGAPNGN